MTPYRSFRNRSFDNLVGKEGWGEGLRFIERLRTPSPQPSPHPNSGLPEFGTLQSGRSRIHPTSAGERERTEIAARQRVPHTNCSHATPDTLRPFFLETREQLDTAASEGVPLAVSGVAASTRRQNA